MAKLGLVDRVLLGRAFTIGMNLVTLVIVAAITAGEAMRLWDPTPSAEKAAALAAHSQQSAVGVILVALGVILEGRHTFLLKVMKAYNVEHLPGQQEFCDVCELFGFYILILGLMVECLGELEKFFPARPLVQSLVGGTSLLIDLLSVVFLVRLMVKIARLDLGDRS